MIDEETAQALTRALRENGNIDAARALYEIERRLAELETEIDNDG